MIARWFSDAEARAALGPVYTSSIPIPLISYSRLSNDERAAEVSSIREDLDTSRRALSGPHRRESWSDAWSERLAAFERSMYDLAALEPPYVSAHQTVRLLGDYARSETCQFETRVYEYIRESMFRSLMTGFDTIHDVGAGTCFNSAAFCALDPSVSVHAYDWAPATSQIATVLRERYAMNISGSLFDFYAPDLRPSQDDVVVTTCAMEQVGESWLPFLENLLRASPGRVVHLEPIYEKYDASIEYDRLAAEYHLSRNYLKGYYPELKRLEAAGKIEILCDHRTGIGSRFHECYTILAWEARR